MESLTARQLHGLRATLADGNHPLGITSGVQSPRGEGVKEGRKEGRGVWVFNIPDLPWKGEARYMPRVEKRYEERSWEEISEREAVSILR